MGVVSPCLSLQTSTCKCAKMSSDNRKAAELKSTIIECQQQQQLHLKKESFFKKSVGTRMLCFYERVSQFEVKGGELIGQTETYTSKKELKISPDMSIYFIWLKISSASVFAGDDYCDYTTGGTAAAVSGVGEGNSRFKWQFKIVLHGDYCDNNVKINNNEDLIRMLRCLSYSRPRDTPMNHNQIHNEHTRIMVLLALCNNKSASNVPPFPHCNSRSNN